jgi:hypothetical protein
MFNHYPSYPRYRTLMLTSPIQSGEDVYALQIALNYLGCSAGAEDGLLGTRTASAIKSGQKKLFLVADGKAGGATQKALAMVLADDVAQRRRIPRECFLGQLDLESAFRLGNYSPQRSDGTYDAGVAQRNTQFTNPPTAFDPIKSIDALADVIAKHFGLFEGLSGKRRWGLAQGAWNAPAFACYIAKEEGAINVTASMTSRPSESSRKVFEAYVANAVAYL